MLFKLNRHVLVMAVGASVLLSGCGGVKRAIAEGVGKELGVSVPVVNKPGANGALNAKELQSAKPDGYKTIADLKRAGKNIKYGTTGVGTGAQLASALTFKTAGIAATDVPFDGGAPAMTALLGQQVDVATFQLGEGIENVKAGKLVPLAVFSAERIAFLPNVPTAREQGYDVVVSQYRFLTAPKGTPDDVKAKLAEAAKKTFATDTYKKFNEANFLTPREVGPDEIKKILDEATAKYKAQIEQFGISLAAKK